MKSPETVLREKEIDLVRVRREVEALRIVLPLLDDPMEVMQKLVSTRSPARPNDNGMADLELYFPFIKNMRLRDTAAGE